MDRDIYKECKGIYRDIHHKNHYWKSVHSYNSKKCYYYYIEVKGYKVSIDTLDDFMNKEGPIMTMFVFLKGATEKFFTFLICIGR